MRLPVGWNLHTFALVLMLIVIFSGFFERVCLRPQLSALMTRNRESATRDAMLEVGEIDRTP